MSKSSIVTLGIVGVVIVSLLMLIGWIVGTLNREMTIRVTVEQKQVDSKNQFDNMWKKINQVAQVTDAQKNALIEIFNGYAKARTGDGKSGTLATWIHESCPNVDTTTFNNLQNIITGSRDAFTMRQTELLDLKREHEKILRTIPSSIVCSMFGRNSIDVTIVTSTKTEEVFKAGKDDDVNVFKK